MNNQELNNYTIQDFLDLKPIIYEYCINLTQKKTSTSWFRDLHDANDLYQEVFLYVHDTYFNAPKEPCEKSKFIQMMKNNTFWAYGKRMKKREFKVTSRVNRIDDSPKDLFLFCESNYENSKQYVDFKKSIDYRFYTKYLKPLEVEALDLYLDGYTPKEIYEKHGRNSGYIQYITKVKLPKILYNDRVKPQKAIITAKPKRVYKLKRSNEKFVKTKVEAKNIDFEKLFHREPPLRKRNDTVICRRDQVDNAIKVYSLYLQGLSHREMSQKLGKSVSQIGVEIYRIKQKIKKYGEC